MRLHALIAAAVLVPCMAVAATPDDTGGTFRLVDQDGRKVTDATYHGKPVLLYFGFSSCPDVCPTDLMRMSRIVRQVEAKGATLTPVFVTVDPQRDTPAKMKTYVGVFGKNFVGLTGSQAQIEEITDKYHVYYKKVAYGQKGQYTMDHSTFMFLLDAQGKYLDHFGRTVEEAVVVQRIGADLAKVKARATAAK